MEKRWGATPEGPRGGPPRGARREASGGLLQGCAGSRLYLKHLPVAVAWRTDCQVARVEVGRRVKRLLQTSWGEMMGETGCTWRDWADGLKGLAVGQIKVCVGGEE